MSRECPQMKVGLLIISIIVTAWLSTTAPSNPYVVKGDPVKIRNVLFIMGDDHAAYALGAYGNSIARTPNLDRLASRGVRFDRAYTNSPVCTPSRQSIITGRLPHAAGVTLLRTPLSDKQVTIAEHLKQSGFITGALGKMHFINEHLRHGFDHRLDISDYRKHLSEHPPRRPPESAKVKPPWRPFRDPARIWLNADVLPLSTYDEESDGTYLARRAIEFLRSNQEGRFCLWLSFYQPHSPFDFPIEYVGKYDAQQMPLPKVRPEDERWIPAIFKDLSGDDRRGIIAAYYTAAEYLDKNVGLVLAELSRLKLDSSTLVIYVADNGYLLGHHGRFEKHAMWEQAVRVPLLISHPARFGQVRSVSALVELVDLVPTILEALEVPPLMGAQGMSLVPLLEGKTRHHRDFVFSEYLEDNVAMVRTPQWKYIFGSGKHDLALGYATGRGAPGRYQLLFNLIEDSDETRNLADDPKHARLLGELRQKMLDVFMKTDSRAPRLPGRLSVEEKLEWFLEPPENQQQ
jgi:choline-sulfatase